MSSILQPEWLEHAACRGSTAPFFPNTGDSGNEAKLVCAGCPVRLECLDMAISDNIRHGVWGGHTPRERNLIRRGLPPDTVKRRLKPIEHGTHRGYVQHQRRGVPACAECLRAHSTYRLHLIKTSTT